jgi:hypothetical protein
MNWSRRGRPATSAEARTEPFGQSRVDLDAQPACHPVGFRKIADVSAEKRRWGVHGVGGGCAGERRGGEDGVAQVEERWRGWSCADCERRREGVKGMGRGSKRLARQGWSL